MMNNSQIYRGAEYASYRPQYPEALFSWLSSLPKDKQHAWDCGTGNGQVAHKLARYFDKVTATDSNADQIAKCLPVRNCSYNVETAENSRLPDKSVDIITVGCAVHWFDTQKFYGEVNRVLKGDGIIAVWCYEYPWTGNEKVDGILSRYKNEILGEFWPPEAQIYFNRYETLNFPFASIEAQIPHFEIYCPWGPTDVLNFMSTWTAPINYKTKNGADPGEQVAEELANAWKEEGLGVGVTLPLYMKVGRL